MTVTSADGRGKSVTTDLGGDGLTDQLEYESFILTILSMCAAYGYVVAINPLFSITGKSNKNTEIGDDNER